MPRRKQKQKMVSSIFHTIAQKLLRSKVYRALFIEPKRLIKTGGHHLSFFQRVQAIFTQTSLTSRIFLVSLLFLLYALWSVFDKL